MKASEREGGASKTGFWTIVVQGIPAAFGMGDERFSEVPDAVFERLRSGMSKNIVNTGCPVLPAIAFGETPDIGPYTAEPYSPRVRAGDFSVKLSDSPESGLAELFAYLSSPVTKTLDFIPRADVSTAAFKVRSVVSLAEGEIIYIGAETFKITNIDIESKTVSGLRGQFGSERPFHPLGEAVYKKPPFWKGRRTALLRHFAEESAEEYEIRWVGNFQGITPISGVSLWELTAVDELRALDREISISGRGKIFAVIKKASEIGWIVGLLPPDSEGEGFDAEVLERFPYVQIGEGIVKAKPYKVKDGYLKYLLVTELGRFGTPLPWKHFSAVEEGRELSDLELAARKELGGDIVFSDEVRRGGLECNQLIVFEDEHLIKGEGSLEEGEAPRGILMKLLQSELGEGAMGKYDVLPFGAGLSEDKIDIFQIDKLREKYPDIRGSLVLGWGGAPFNLRSAIEDYCLAPFFAKLIPQADGRISARFPYELSPLAAGKLSVTAADIIFDKKSYGKYDFDEAYTEWSAEYNRPAVGEERRRIGKWVPVTINKPFSTSRGFYGRYKSAFKFRLWCMEGLSHLSFAARRMELVELRNSRPLPRLIVWTRLKYWSLEAGDIVKVNFEDIPIYDPSSGASKMPANLRCEVLRKEYELSEELIKLELLPLGLYSRRAGVIAPCGLVVSAGGAGSERIVELEERYFSSGEFDLETGEGGRDIEHFSAGDRLRFYRPSSGEWINGAGEKFYEATLVEAETNRISIAVNEIFPPNILPGDIMEYAEFPFVTAGANSAEQKKRAFMADDGASPASYPPEWDEALPSTYAPVPIYDIEPYMIMVG